jgi:hypothetical protein
MSVDYPFTFDSRGRTCPFRLTIPCSRRNHGRLAVRHTAPWPRICESEHQAGREGREAVAARAPLAADVSVAGAAAGRGLSCPAAVPVMEAADHGCLDDPALIEALHRSGLWGVLV